MFIFLRIVVEPYAFVTFSTCTARFTSIVDLLKSEKFICSLNSKTSENIEHKIPNWNDQYLDWVFHFNSKQIVLNDTFGTKIIVIHDRRFIILLLIIKMWFHAEKTIKNLFRTIWLVIKKLLCWLFILFRFGNVSFFWSIIIFYWHLKITHQFERRGNLSAHLKWELI